MLHPYRSASIGQNWYMCPVFAQEVEKCEEAPGSLGALTLPNSILGSWQLGQWRVGELEGVERSNMQGKVPE